VKVGVRTYRRPHGLLSKLESRAVKAAGAILRGRRHGDVTLLPDQLLVKASRKLERYANGVVRNAMGEDPAIIRDDEDSVAHR
jgi:hypothetical protein